MSPGNGKVTTPYVLKKIDMLLKSFSRTPNVVVKKVSAPPHAWTHRATLPAASVIALVGAAAFFFSSVDRPARRSAIP